MKRYLKKAAVVACMCIGMGMLPHSAHAVRRAPGALEQLRTRINALASVAQTPEAAKNVIRELRANEGQLMGYQPSWYNQTLQQMQERAQVAIQPVRMPDAPTAAPIEQALSLADDEPEIATGLVKPAQLPASIDLQNSSVKLTENAIRPYIQTVVDRATQPGALRKDSIFFKTIGSNYMTPRDFLAETDRLGTDDLSARVKMHAWIEQGRARDAQDMMSRFERAGALSEMGSLLGRDDLAQKIHNELSYWLLYDLLTQGQVDARMAPQHAQNLFELNFNYTKFGSLQGQVGQVAGNLQRRIGQRNFESLASVLDKKINENPFASPAEVADKFSSVKQQLMAQVPDQIHGEVDDLVDRYVALNTQFAQLQVDIARSKQNVRSDGYAIRMSEQDQQLVQLAQLDPEQRRQVMEGQMPGMSRDREMPAPPAKRSRFKLFMKVMLAAALFGAGATAFYKIYRKQAEQGEGYKAAAGEVASELKEALKAAPGRAQEGLKGMKDMMTDVFGRLFGRAGGFEEGRV